MLMVLTHVAKTKLVKTFFVESMLPSFSFIRGAVKKK
jgi:hypothetical protein